jgi:hypothetical protein
LVAFVGSYATEELGYKKWGKFLAIEAIKLVRSRALKRGEQRPAWVLSAIREMSRESSNSPVLFDLVEEYSGRYSKSLGAVRRQRIALAREHFSLIPSPTVPANGSTPYHIVESLGIDRVITTNYDLEFEWLWLTTAAERAATPANAREGLLRRSPIERDPECKHSMVRKLPDGRSSISDVFQRGRADRLKLGPIERSDLAVHIAAAEHDTNVIGMNFLSSLSAWGVEGSTLVLRS